jgi:hypothetical protein
VGYARSLAASERVALGTDGYPADMPAELAELERIAAAAGETAGAPALRARLEAGHRLATELFGAETLAQDAVVLEAEPEPGPARPGRAPTRARRVRVGGEVVVERGRLTRADLGEIRARAREQAPRLWERMAEID